MLVGWGHLRNQPNVAGVNGEFFGGGQRERAARVCYDHSVQDRLWTVSATLCGLG